MHASPPRCCSVGSLPVDSTESAFRAGAELVGDMVFALPDGETGPRAAWVGYEHEALVRPNPDIVVLEETGAPDVRPRHVYDRPGRNDVVRTCAPVTTWYRVAGIVKCT